MQLLNTLVGTAATRLGKAVLNGVSKSIKNLTKESSALEGFSDLLNRQANSTNASKELNLADMELSPQELSMVLRLRENALNQGQDFIQFELHNHNFSMDVETMDMKTV